MSLVLDDPQTVAIAHKLAVAEGVTVEQAIRLSLEASAARVRLPPEQAVNEALTELRTWAQSHIQRAPGDTVSVDEILGYSCLKPTHSKCWILSATSRPSVPKPRRKLRT